MGVACSAENNVAEKSSEQEGTENVATRASFCCVFLRVSYFVLWLKDARMRLFVSNSVFHGQVRLSLSFPYTVSRVEKRLVGTGKELESLLS